MNTENMCHKRQAIKAIKCLEFIHVQAHQRNMRQIKALWASDRLFIKKYEDKGNGTSLPMVDDQASPQVSKIIPSAELVLVKVEATPVCRLLPLLSPHLFSLLHSPSFLYTPHGPCSQWPSASLTICRMLRVSSAGEGYWLLRLA